MKKDFLKKLTSATLTTALAISMAGTMPVIAATTANTNNNTAVQDSLTDSDIIDTSKKGSIDIYKYDQTSAEFDGIWSGGNDATVKVKVGDQTYTVGSTGQKNATVENAMSKYGIKGVEFSYIFLGNIEQYSYTSSGVTKTAVVYEIDQDLADILGLSANDATDMTATGVANKCNNDKLHYTSQQLQDALSEILADDNTAAKNALEKYAEAHVTGRFTDTDASGHTSVSNLELGLYLIVETEVPEEVTSTTDPWFVSVPFTNIGDDDMTAQDGDDTAGGEKWVYNAYCYPKNKTGNPTIDKLVRNAFGTADDAGVYNTDYIVSTNDAAVDADSEGTANKGYYNFASTTTASAGDVLDYVVISELPTITSGATYLSQYTFKDTLSAGITYNKDVKVFLSKDYDATKNTFGTMLDLTATLGDTSITYTDLDGGASSLNIDMSAALDTINTNNAAADTTYKYIVVSYSATVNSDAALVLGDEGNPNDVSLTWERTSEDYSNTIEDRSYVYSYGLDLTKYFSDNAGDFSKVQFTLYNVTDGYYVVADTVNTANGDNTYYVGGTGDVANTTLGKTVDKDKATVFTPNADGKLDINGLEADEYELVEIATDDGYKLLTDPITIKIDPTTREIRPSESGYVGNDAVAAHTHTEACQDATGAIICGNAATETANGRTIGKTAMYVGDVTSATASVDDVETQMGADADSENATVALEITNSKSFFFPMTGGNGTLLFTLAGGVVALAGVIIVTKRKKEEKEA
jgi:fimbrial isopeptide formation D2 family protein/LPXTG-motif cell wall-anchored protein